MSAPPDNAAIVASMVRECDFVRYAATLFAPPDKRRAMLALAAFDLEIQRIPDSVSQALPGEVRLQWWIDALQGTEHGGIAGHPVAAELLRAIEVHALPRAPFLALIGARRFDLYDDPMPTMAALEVYCDDTCGSMIGVNAHVLAAASVDFRDAGRAMGLAYTVARMAHDAAHRRCFVPADAMAAHGITRHQVLAGEASDSLRVPRDELIDAAKQNLKRMRLALKQLPRPIRPAFLPLATLDRELERLRKEPTFGSISPPSRLRILTSQWRMMR